MAIASDRTVYVADMCNYVVRKISPSLPGLGVGESRIASEDGTEVYFFSGAGKHERTLDALTGIPKYVFNYDNVPASPTAGRLVSITHGDGSAKTTVIQYPDSTTRNIISPFNQTTTIKLDNNGFAQSIASPAGERYQFSYVNDGLLETFKDPSGALHSFRYESDGRLKVDSDPTDAGGSKTLTRTGMPADYTVAVTTALNRQTKYHVATRPQIDQTLTSTEPSGGQVTGIYRANGTEDITMADGSKVTRSMFGDPRFGMQSPIEQSVTLQTGTFSDGSTSATLSHTPNFPAVTLTDPKNPFSMTSRTDSISLNGATPTTITYTAASKTLTRTSPMQRTTTTTFDDRGRVVGMVVPGLVRSWVYDSNNGVLNSVSVGSRLTSFTPGAPPDGLPNIVTTSDGHSVTLQRDSVGRVLHALQTGTGSQADAGIVTLDLGTGYDLNSNLSSVKPSSSSPAHALLYNSVNLLATYTPPPATGSTGIVGYHYNADRQLDKITRPDNSAITFGFESSPNSGRVNSVTFPNWGGSGTVSSNLTYDPATRYLQSVSEGMPQTMLNS